MLDLHREHSKNNNKNIKDNTNDEEEEEELNLPRRRGNFPHIVYQLLDYAAKKKQHNLEAIVSWDEPDGTSFGIHCPTAFMTELASKFFPSHSSFRSFERMLNLWGLERFQKKDRLQTTPSKHYHHPCFVRGQRHLLKTIQRVTMKKKKTSMRLSNGVILNQRLSPQLLVMQRAALQFLQIKNEPQTNNKTVPSHLAPPPAPIHPNPSTTTTTRPASNQSPSNQPLKKRPRLVIQQEDLPVAVEPTPRWFVELNLPPRPCWLPCNSLGHGRRTKKAPQRGRWPAKECLDVVLLGSLLQRSTHHNKRRHSKEVRNVAGQFEDAPVSAELPTTATAAVSFITTTTHLRGPSLEPVFPQEFFRNGPARRLVEPWEPRTPPPAPAPTPTPPRAPLRVVPRWPHMEWCVASRVLPHPARTTSVRLVPPATTTNTTTTTTSNMHKNHLHSVRMPPPTSRSYRPTMTTTTSNTIPQPDYSPQSYHVTGTTPLEEESEKKMVAMAMTAKAS
jgi:hypothetical protein